MTKKQLTALRDEMHKGLIESLQDLKESPPGSLLQAIDHGSVRRSRQCIELLEHAANIKPRDEIL